MSSSLAIAKAAAKVTTIGQARAALGVVTSVLRQAYEKIDQVDQIGAADIVTGFAALKYSSVRELRQAARDRLDVVNAYAGRIYAIWTGDADLQDEEISTTNALKVALCCAQANDALENVEQLAHEKLWDLASLLEESVRATGQIAGASVQAVTSAVAAGVGAFVWGAWPTLLVIGVALFVLREPVKKALKGALP